MIYEIKFEVKFNTNVESNSEIKSGELTEKYLF